MIGLPKRISLLLIALIGILSLICSVSVLADENILRISTINEVKSPAFIGDYTLGLFNHISNPPLMQMDQNGKLIGLLADHYEVSSDNTEWTFYIKENQFWSDGTPVTADDVAFSIQMYGNSVPNAGWIGETLKDITVDGNKVTFSFNKPYTNLDLEFTSYSILPKHIWESIENPNEYTSTGPFVGAGPFYIDNVDLNAGKIIFKKNPAGKEKTRHMIQ